MSIGKWTARVVVLAAVLHASTALPSDLVGVPRIMDGDTVEISGTKIRLEGIDAPETDQLCLDPKGVRWACGAAARDTLVRHAGGQPWTCRGKGQDKYGRTLGACTVAGKDVERWMVRTGWAMAFVRFSQAYVASERAARNAKAGLWAGAFIAPWDWRDRNPKSVVLGATSVPANAQAILLGAASSSAAPDAACTIKGNVNRAGECIFHTPGGRWYAKVNMDPSKGKRWFCSVALAEAAGCRAAIQ